MKNLAYFIFTLLLLFVIGCQKESFTSTTEVTNPDPKELDYPVFDGRVTSESDDPLEDIEIEVFQGDSLVTTLITDENGYYTTLGTELTDEQYVTLAVVEEGYTPKYRRDDIQGNNVITNNMSLSVVSAENIAAQDNIHLNPGDSRLIKVYGTFTDIDDEPVVGAYALLGWDFVETSPTSYQFRGAFDRSDNDGYVEMLIEPGNDVYALAGLFDSTVECGKYLIVGDEDASLGDPEDHFYSLDVLNDDIELIENKESFEGTTYSMFGTIQDCDGNPVNSGTLNVTVITRVSENSTIQENTEITNFDANGGFTYEYTTCRSGDRTVDLYYLDENNYGFRVEGIELSSQNTNLGTHKACDDYNQYDEWLLDFTIGSSLIKDSIDTQLNFENDTTSIFCFDIILPQFSLVRINATLGPIGLGLYDFNSFEFSTGNVDFQDYLFEANPGELQVEFTDYTDGYYSGYISGNVETEGAGLQEVSAFIKVHE